MEAEKEDMEVADRLADIIWWIQGNIAGGDDIFGREHVKALRKAKAIFDKRDNEE